MFDDTDRNPFSRASGTGRLLTIVAHTASFEDAILQDEPIVKQLIGLARLNRFRLIFSPTENRRVIDCLRRHHWQVEIGEFDVDGEWLSISTPMPAPGRHRLSYLGDWRRPAQPGSLVTVVDELFTNPLDVDLFIAADGDPFLERDPRRRWIVSLRDALDLVRVLVTTLDSEDSFYFHFRAAKLFPAADLGRVAMNIAREHGFPAKLRAQIESSRQRIELILRAADRVAYHALRRPDGRVAGKCGYHLAYFIMLVTGLFDELAAIVAAHYELKLKSQDVRLRVHEAASFYRILEDANPELYRFLAEPGTQAIIRLFYPARNQVQHRAVLTTRLAEERRPRRVLARLPRETLKEIKAVAPDVGWGVIDRSAGEVDPYLFTLAAVEAVAKVADGVLGKLEWSRYADLLPADVREERRALFETEIGLAPILRFRSHHPDSIPPYF